MRLDITINRLGGEEGPRRFQRNTNDVDPTAGTILFEDVVSTDNPSYWLRLQLWELIPAQEDFLSCLAKLETAEGYQIATRPVLIYDRPCDVAVWSTFERVGLSYLGVYSVGLRRIS